MENEIICSTYQILKFEQKQKSITRKPRERMQTYENLIIYFWMRKKQ